MDLFKFDSPAEKVDSYPENFQEEVLDKIVQYAVENKMIEENERILFETKIMGIVSLRPSPYPLFFPRTHQKSPYLLQPVLDCPLQSAR